MAKKFDNIIVLDLEATCWETPEEQGDQVSEIIEFGLCNYHPESRQISKKMSILVRPTTSKVSEYCTKLTGHTWEKLRIEGIPFDGALNRLRKEFGPKNRIVASWGNYDWSMVAIQCLREDQKFPFGRSHINIKELYTVRYGHEKSLGLQAALDLEKMGFTGIPHHGDDDAYNAARILKLIMGDAHGR